MILDGIVALLLATTIIYCWRLSKRLSNLHASRQELQKFIEDFNDSINRANASVSLLKALSNETDTTLRSQIEKARFIANDLAFLTHKGNNIANKLEEYIANSRAVDPNPMGLKSAGKALLQQARAMAVEAAEAEAHGAPQAWKFTEKQPGPSRSVIHPQEMAPSKKQAMEAALAQIASRKKNPAPKAAKQNAKAERTIPRAREERVIPPAGNISSARESVDTLRASIEIKT